MGFDLVTNIEQCLNLVRDYVPVSLVYYSHIPAVIASLFIGIVVFIKSGRTLVSKILLGIVISFSLWSGSDIILWTSYDSRMYMFFWQITLIFEALIFILSLYLIYVFIDKKDVSFKIKLIWGLFLLPIIFVLGTSYYLTKFSIVDCIPVESSFYNIFALPLYGAIYLWILILTFNRYKKAEKEFKKQILLIFLGVTALLLLFLFGKILAEYLIDKGFMNPTQGYAFEFYGLFGMPIFMAFLAYLIVKFEAFNVKMIGAQALVAGLVILIGSQFFFIKSFTNQILTGITLILSIVFGWALIHSVKLEVERKEELQKMSTSLALANDKLRKLDNAKSEFISIASHQLRTPLTAIKGFISLILEDSYGKVSAEIRDVLNKVYISNERLIELVEDLLNLSRIESGRMEYTFEKTNLGELCQEIYDTFSLRAKEKDLRLELIVPKNSTAEANTDRSKVREVISNMVDNALKYTPKGGVKMKISEDNTNVLVAIIDTGIGVPEEEMPYLFSKFSRGKDINRLNAGGTGLGLHVARKVMEAVGGRIWVESAGTNLGSTFFLEIPKEHVERE